MAKNDSSFSFDNAPMFADDSEDKGAMFISMENSPKEVMDDLGALYNAAFHGDADAQWKLGACVAQKEGGSFQEVMFWWSKAADNGNELAMKLLSETCAKGVELAGTPVIRNEKAEAVTVKKETVRKEEKQETVCMEKDVMSIELAEGIKLDMVFVEKGSFTMSARDGENERSEVEHKVELTKSFRIGKFPVTQGQWTAIMGWNPSDFEGKEDCENYPVESVSWNDAMELCDRLNEGGLAPKGWKFTLPTETQWEYAAKGGSRSSRCKYAGGDDIEAVAWYDGNNGRSTHAVGQKIPNKLGLHDMSGNVWEWCLDKWVYDSSKLEPEFLYKDGEDEGSLRAYRGGSWGSYARGCRVAERGYGGPTIRGNRLGFRLALVCID